MIDEELMEFKKQRGLKELLECFEEAYDFSCGDYPYPMGVCDILGENTETAINCNQEQISNINMLMGSLVRTVMAQGTELRRLNKAVIDD